MKVIIFIIISLLSFTSYAEFKSEDSASITLTGGNTEFESYALKSLNSYQKNKNSFNFNGIYNYGESRKIRSAENWSIEIRYDYSLSEKQSLYVGEVAEANRFSGIKRRYNTDLGYKYIFIKSDEISFLSEIGYRYSIEKNVESSTAAQKDSKGRLYIEVSKNLKGNIKGKFWIEYLPNFSHSKDYFLNLEPSLIISLTSIFSMKTAYLWKYNNGPSLENSKHDYNYTLTLIANF
jgi:putative salt-induced outer membrane protein